MLFAFVWSVAGVSPRLRAVPAFIGLLRVLGKKFTCEVEGCWLNAESGKGWPLKNTRRAETFDPSGRICEGQRRGAGAADSKKADGRSADSLPACPEKILTDSRADRLSALHS